MDKEQILDFLEGNEEGIMKEYIFQEGVIKNFLTFLLEEKIGYNELYDFCYDDNTTQDFLDFVKENYKEAMDEFEVHCEEHEQDIDILPEVRGFEK